MHRIVIDLNDLDSAIRDIKAYAKMVEECSDAIAYRVAEQAQQTAQEYYEDYRLENFAEVDQPVPNATGNGYVVSASAYDNKGRNVLMFEEFGAGDTAGMFNDKADEFGALPGTYSETHRRYYYEHGYWFYRREFFHEVAGTNAMTNAAFEARDNVYWIAPQVFEERSF